MALSLLSATWAKHHRVEPVGLIVDHGIRPESTEEAQRTRKQLSLSGMAAHILVPDTPITGSNLQEKAREARYRMMTGWCHRHSVGHLLLGHHAGDQLETILMRLVRGSGLEGLCGMRPLSQRDGISLVRPLLSFEKARLEATLREAGIDWIEDSSNRDPRYTRNRLRPLADALMREGLSGDRLARVTTNLQRADALITRQAEAFFSAHVTRVENGLTCPLDCWRHGEPEIARRVLNRLLIHVGGQDKAPRADKLASVLAALLEGKLQKRRTLGRCILTPRLRANRLEITPEHAISPETSCRIVKK